MDADIENELNKIKWEKWRAKQKSEREKTCFYCWGNWSNWSEWSDICGGSSEGTCVTLTMSAKYTHPTPVNISYDAKFCGATGQVGCGANIYSCVDTRISAVGGGWSSDWQHHCCGIGCDGVSGTHSHGISPLYQGKRMRAYARAEEACAFVVGGWAVVECEVG